MNESSVKHIHQPSSSQDKNLSEEPNIEPSPHQNELENFLEISKEPMDAVRTIKLDRHLPIIKSQKSNKSISFIINSENSYENLENFLRSQDFSKYSSLKITSSSSYKLSQEQYDRLAFLFDDLDSFKSLMALKIKILDSNLEKIELMFFRNLSRQLKTLKIIVNSVVSIKIDQENLILQIPKKIENLKLWFYPAFSMEFSKTIKLKFLKNLKLSSEFQKEHEGLCFECPRIKDLSIYLPNKVGEKIVIEFFKRHLQLRTVKLTFTSLNFHEILSEIRKLAFLQRFTIIFKSTVNFSDKLLEELVEVLLEKGPEQEDLLKIEIEILNYLPNIKTLICNDSFQNIFQIYPKINNFLINSIDIRKKISEETLYLSAKAKEYDHSIRNLVYSKTILDFISKAIPKSIPFEDIEKNIKFDLLYQEQENSQKDSYFEFSYDKIDDFLFFLKYLDYFINNTQIEKIYLHFSDKKISHRIEEYFNTKDNLYVFFKTSSDSNPINQKWELPKLDKITGLKLLFENSLNFSESFLYFLNESTCFPNLKDFYLEFNGNSKLNSKPSPKSKIICPIKILSKLKYLNLKIDQIDFKNNQISVLSDIYEYFNSEKEIGLKTFEFFLKDAQNNERILSEINNIVDFLPNKLTIFHFQIPSLRGLNNSRLSNCFKSLQNIPSLTSLDLNLENSNVSHITISHLKEYLETTAKSLKTLSLNFKNNGLKDNSISSFWSAFNSNFMPELEELRLYLHINQLTWQVLHDMASGFDGFPETITYLKIDLHENNLCENSTYEILEKNIHQILKIFQLRLTRLETFQFHMNQCGLGKEAIKLFLEDAACFEASEVFFDLSVENKWEKNEILELENLIFNKFKAPNARIWLKHRDSRFLKGKYSRKKISNSPGDLK